MGIPDDWIKEYFHVPYAVAFDRLRHRQNAEDVAQETWCKAHNQFDNSKFAKSTAFASWLAKIAVNCVLDFRRQSRPTVPLNENVSQSRAHPEPAEDLTCVFRQAGLDLNEIAVYVCFHGETMSDSEIADRLFPDILNRDAARQRVARIRRTAQGKLERYRYRAEGRPPVGEKEP
jgi:DNA-directed RNA polymerase specialized sigma24 family protein